MELPPETKKLGDYLCKSPLAQSPLTTTWLAEQISVGRTVLIDELHGDLPEHHEAFVADVRAKAAVEHPVIASVYEAVATPGASFYAYERLPGRSLQDLCDAGETLMPVKLAHVLHRICEANLNHEAHQRSTTALTLNDVFVDEHDVVRLRNLATSLHRGEHESERDIVALGRALQPLVAEGAEGATRLQTLLAWMRGKEIQSPLTWQEVLGFCNQIDQQLSTIAFRSNSASAVRAKRWMIAGIVALALVVAGGVGVVYWLKEPAVPPVVDPPLPRPSPVLIPAGPYATPDGAVQELPAFLISGHEVTIGDYAQFLDTLNRLASEERQRSFDHESQPAGKTSHEPQDWSMMLATARSGGSWNGKRVTLDSPVVGVDWWDASAYATWKRGRLPTPQEWFAALHYQLEDPSELQPSNWLPVTSPTPDLTPAGIHGMAGSVAEWTRIPVVNPSNPLGPRMWVIAGGSHLKPGKGALSREWTDNRAQRRPDLGFRLVFDPQQQ